MAQMCQTGVGEAGNILPGYQFDKADATREREISVARLKMHEHIKRRYNSISSLLSRDGLRCCHNANTSHWIFGVATLIQGKRNFLLQIVLSARVIKIPAFTR